MLFDIIFMLILFGAVTLGFFRGIIPVVVLMVMFYLSNVLASLYFPALGLFVEQRYGTPPDIARYTSFFIVLVISFATLSTGGLYTFRYAKMPRRLEQFDRVAGVLLSLALTFIMTTIFAFLLWNISVTTLHSNGQQEPNMQETLEPKAQSTMVTNIAERANQSFIVQYFSVNVLSGVRQLIVPILPEGATLIFDAPMTPEKLMVTTLP